MPKSFDSSFVREIRRNFPRIDRDFSGTKRIFLDNGAGSLVLKSAAMAEYNSRINYSANTDAIYSESRSNEQTIAEGRRAVSDLLGATDDHSIFQAESASSLFFSVSYALRHQLKRGSNVVSTQAEHFANVAPYMELKRSHQIDELRLARINHEDGTIDMDHLSSLVDKNTKLIAITAESNLLGNKIALSEVSKIAREYNAMVLIDGVHFTPQAHVNVSDIDCDFFVFSAYKIFGPRGSFMYVNNRAWESLKPFHVDRDANRRKGSFIELGTKDQSLFAAASEIVAYIARLSLGLDAFKKGSVPKSRRSSVEKGMSRVEAYQNTLTKSVLNGIEDFEGLSSLRNVRLYGISDISRIHERGSTFSFNFKNMDDRRAEELYWKRFKITVVGGNHWNLSHEVYSNQSMLRVTFLHYNSMHEVMKFLQATEWLSKQ